MPLAPASPEPAFLADQMSNKPDNREQNGGDNHGDRGSARLCVYGASPPS